MTNDYIYNIAEWLAYNAGPLKARAKAFFSHMEKEDALAYMIGEEMKYNYEQVAVAFQDERVRIILDRYYLKEMH